MTDTEKYIKPCGFPVDTDNDRYTELPQDTLVNSENTIFYLNETHSFYSLSLVAIKTPFGNIFYIPNAFIFDIGHFTWERCRGKRIGCAIGNRKLYLSVDENEICQMTTDNLVNIYCWLSKKNYNPVDYKQYVPMFHNLLIKNGGSISGKKTH